MTAPPLAAQEITVQPSAAATNYVIASSHPFFGSSSRQWVETSASLGAVLSRGWLHFDLGGLVVKTSGLDPFGTGSEPAGAPAGTPRAGLAPRWVLDRAALTLGPFARVPLQLTVGRQPLTIGSHFLIGDGVYDGFAPSTDGGVWHNPRKTFDAVRLRGEIRGSRLDAFLYRVDQTWDAAGGRDGRVLGLDLSHSFSRFRTDAALGLFYRWSPSRLDNDMAVLNLRLEHAIVGVPGLVASGEVAWELGGRCRNPYYCTTPGQSMNESAWHGELRFADTAQKAGPLLEVGLVRYSKDFTPLAPGFSDWGKWYLGNQIDWLVFGTNTVVLRAAVGYQARAGLRLRVLYHNTREAASSGASTGGTLSNEVTLVNEWMPTPRFWLNLALGYSIPGPALAASGMGNPFAGLNQGAVPAGMRRSFDLVLATGIVY